MLEKIWMPRAPRSSHRAARFAHRGVGIVERQRRHETREAIRIAPDQFRHAVVGEPREIERPAAGRP